MSHTAVPISEDDLIKKRLLIEGDSGNEDRLINKLIKNFTKRLIFQNRSYRSFQIKSNNDRIQLWPLGSFGFQHFLWHEFEPRNCIDNFSRLNYFLPSPLAAFDYLVFLGNSFSGRLAFIFLLFRDVLECSAH